MPDQSMYSERQEDWLSLRGVIRLNKNNILRPFISISPSISTQSDSDSSISSIEITSETIGCQQKKLQQQQQHQNNVSNNPSSSPQQPPSSSPQLPESLVVRCCWRWCGIEFDCLDQLGSHISNVHASSGPGGLFYCGWEGCERNSRGFNARYKMLVHVRTHTKEKPHGCQMCGKSFSRAENLKIHRRSHSGEKPYRCPVEGCTKAYANSSDRFKHTRTHQMEKPYQCKVAGCAKRYTDPSSLRKHVKTYKHFVSDDRHASEDSNDNNNNNNNNNSDHHQENDNNNLPLDLSKRRDS